ncbi:MAG TPA: feruloyl-CoA synthase [Bryobacteraceae bacterium]|nr:feruloyl-CoA synthase [Bryobacteraceae bacterium]
MPARAEAAPVRHVRIAPSEVVIERAPGGIVYARSPQPLGPYPEKLTGRLDHWAAVAPDRAFIAKRAPTGEWRRLTYAEAREKGRSIAQSLLNRGLSADRPIAILSGNDLEHALLGIGALYAGIPYAPISPAYSLVSTDFAKLRHILQLLTPGMVFAARGAQFQRAINAVVPDDAELVVAADPLPGATLFSDLLATTPGPSLEAASAKITGDTIAKILFTSGSTGMPKGVINTHRMWSSNQEMARAMFPFVDDEPPVLVDWLPWNHTFAGNSDVGLVLYNGGSYYIDEGKPTPSHFHETVRNLKEIAPTIYLNVPKGFEALAEALRHDAALRRNFFSRLRLMYYAGAGLSQPVWDALESLSIETCGEKILMLAGLGSTETAPHALFADREQASQAGHVGVPARGVELKLVPVGEKLEARLRGPNITPGYWRQPELTRAAFDEEGFYKLGDALRFVDESDPRKGFVFDGRIAEDFKLSTGTWVSVGPLRAAFLRHFAPFAQDVVIAGHDRDYIAALIFPDLDACRRHVPEIAAGAPASELLAGAAIRSLFEQRLREFARASTGSSNRIAAAILLDTPPSIDAHEITDKGSLNQGAILRHRAAIVEELYRGSPRVLTIGEKS